MLAILSLLASFGAGVRVAAERGAGVAASGQSMAVLV